MLKGCDISNYQATTPDGYDFYIIKASEGNGYKDPRLDQHYNAVKAKKKLAGFYHYARPDLGNTPQAEADFFVSLVGHNAGHAVFALDWEGNSLKYPLTWAKTWLDRVYEKTGVRPMIYTSSSVVMSQDFSAIANANYGLWIAHWAVEKPVFRAWKTWAIWQYGGTGIDSNYFNGDQASYLAYCKSDKSTGTPTTPPKKSVSEIASEVIAGKWGNGADRKNRITAAGYNFDEVQAAVNSKLGATTKKEATYAVALDVLKGVYGNGQARVDNLKAKGYNYNEVQSKVNTLVSVAKKVIHGDFGNGATRVNLLRQRGFDPNIVQQAVNLLL